MSSSSLHPGWRSAQTCVSCHIGVVEGTNRLEAFEEQERLKASAAGFAERLRNFGDGEYLNEADTDNPNWKVDYWGHHHDKLLRIKIRYDPYNIFFCHHCVGSTFYSIYMESSGSRLSTGRMYMTFAIMVLSIGIN